MKLGKIKISDSFYLEDKTLELIPIFTRFVPIHIEIRPHMRDYVYTGICDDFIDLKEGESIPEYIVSVTTNEAKNITNVEYKCR